MANTYELIASNTVASGGAASVTFSSISGSYTDLLVKMSVRTGRSAGVDPILVTYNGSGTTYSEKVLLGSGSSASSSTSSSVQELGWANDAATTSNTFSNGEIYIPNYASTNYKSASSDQVSENNGTTAYAALVAGLWSNTAAITSITFTSETSNTILQYSTFYLYGIKNS